MDNRKQVSAQGTLFQQIGWLCESEKKRTLDKADPMEKKSLKVRVTAS